MQLGLFDGRDDLDAAPSRWVEPLRPQLLKWIGSKQRVAPEIVSHFPPTFGAYVEPFLGSGGVLGTLAPERAVASDVLPPLIEIWQTLSRDRQQLVSWYRDRWQAFVSGGRAATYERIRDSYNQVPNGADLLFLSRTCYGGVVRFRRADGHMSTPCGVHDPISPQAFEQRVSLWHARTRGATFICGDFEPVMDSARPGDLVYCDPPYVDTQSIVYGAQAFSLPRLLRAIARCKARGVYVALSIDGTKRSGSKRCCLWIPEGLFERQVMVNCGRSMLRRFQMGGATLEGEVVADRLLLTY